MSCRIAEKTNFDDQTVEGDSVGFKKSKPILIAAVAVTIGAFFFFDLGHYLTLEYFKSQQQNLDGIYRSHPALTIGIYFVIYVVSTALSFPGATVLTLAGGALFGFWLGTMIVSFASTIGAVAAFLMARLILRDYVQEKFSDRLKVINKGLETEGEFYLFTLRLVPIVPFFVINLAMGLTPIKTWRFFFVSQIGMLLGTAVYVNAGTQVAQLESVGGIMSPGLLLSFVLLGIFPLLTKKMLGFIKSRKASRVYEAPKKFDYNIVVIGAGAAGLVSSYIAAAVKAKVALIEKHKMGGDCLNTGCVPSKALIKSAKVVASQHKAKDYGLKSIAVDYSFGEVMERVQRVIKTVEPHDSKERYESLGVECINGNATIKTPYEVEVSGKILTTKNIIIATGGSPFVPKIPGLEEVSYKTSDTIWELRERPERLLVLGGGPIGAELAQAFHRLGSNVTIVEMATRILAREDEEISKYVMEQFTKEGITVLANHKATRCFTANGKQYLQTEKDGTQNDIEFDVILLALGRRPNIDGFGAKELGIETTERGQIAADPFLRTNFPNIFVCGDVTGDYQFTHVAAHEAWYATVNALFRPFKSFAADYRVIPMATYTDPEVARVGMNELEAQTKGIKYEVTIYGIDDLDRAIADEAAEGVVKILTVPGKDKILGVTIVGQHAGDILSEFVLAMKYNLGLNKILGTIHAYPTLAEANKYAAGVWKKNHAPKKVLLWLEKFHAWRRGSKKIE
jgi:pyruvate/2-oxoglutarate dehydrogenase complex dihydrolipoamide dehydrogenase (E3) component/uncharacterized membrane protein YdjX (TVP38/TMEM64 family)